MKNLFSILVILFFAFNSLAATSTPQFRKSFGLGGVIGSPTAMTGKSYLTSQTALDFGLSFFASEYTLIYGDYLIHYPGFTKAKGLENLVGYLGVGGVMAFSSKTRDSNSGLLGTSQGSVGLGVRVPFGVLINMNTAPVEFFGEIAPGISIIPSTSILIEIGIGGRYFF